MSSAEWQPIETAPKDGPVDLWCVDDEGRGRRHPGCRWNFNGHGYWDGYWVDSDDYRLSNHDVTPTHWMRVAPPVSTTMEKQQLTIPNVANVEQIAALTAERDKYRAALEVISGASDRLQAAQAACALQNIGPDTSHQSE